MKPDPTAYNLDGAFLMLKEIQKLKQKRTDYLRDGSPKASNGIRSKSPPSFGMTTFGVARECWDKVVSPSKANY